MRIIRSTREELSVASEPWLLAVMLAVFIVSIAYVLFAKHEEMSWAAILCATALLVFLAAALAGLARWTTVTLSKASGRIAFETRALIGGGKRIYALSDLDEARADILEDADGRSSRLLFAFRETMAETIDPVERARMENLKRRGLRRARLTDIPLTVYYVGGDCAERLAAEINAWLKT